MVDPGHQLNLAGFQLIVGGHFTVNGKKATIPSMRLKPGDVIGVRERSRKSPLFGDLLARVGQVEAIQRAVVRLGAGGVDQPFRHVEEEGGDLFLGVLAAEAVEHLELLHLALHDRAVALDDGDLLAGESKTADVDLARAAAALAPLALRAVERVRANSELKDLWEESDPAEWNGLKCKLWP